MKTITTLLTIVLMAMLTASLNAQTFEMVKDINLSGDGGNSGSFFEYNNQLYFGADDGVNGRELWVTDGTVAGTQMVKDIYPGMYGSAEIIFSNSPDGLQIEITDDGIGYEGDKLTGNQGLYSISQRLKSIGGNFKITKIKSGGTQAKVEVTV